MASAKENQVKSLKAVIAQECFTAQIAFMLKFEQTASISQEQIDLGNCRWGKHSLRSSVNLLCFWINKQTGLTRMKDEIRSLGRVGGCFREDLKAQQTFFKFISLKCS